MLTENQPKGPRCYKCDGPNHKSYQCTRSDGLRLCFACKEYMTKEHIDAGCPMKVPRLAGRGRGRGNPRYVNGRGRSSYRGGRGGFRGTIHSDKRKNVNQRGGGPPKRGKISNNKSQFHVQRGGKDHEESNNSGNSAKQGKESVACFVRDDRCVDSTFPEKEYPLLVRCISDSGATNHMTNSRVVFKSFDPANRETSRCADNDSSANFESEGAGSIEIKLSNGDKTEIDNVIYASNLSENLLSLRKFAEAGLAIYLDDERINIFDRESNELFLTGIYSRPFWIIELQIDKDGSIDSESSIIDRKLYVNLTELASNGHFTRSVARKLESNTCQNNNPSETETRNEKGTENECASGISNFDVTICDRKFDCVDELSETGIPIRENLFENINKEFLANNKALLWHARLGHVSLKYLKKLQANHPESKSLKEAVFDESIMDCGVCALAKLKKRPFSAVRVRATEPLQIIHADTMGPISPTTHPKRYRFVAVFVDDYSRLAMAYPMRHKNETGYCLESFVKSARNILGRDAKVCFLRCDQGTEYTGGYTVEVLEKLTAELQMACPDTPQHNGGAERFNQTIQKRVRAYMFDSGIPENMWDLALGAAVYAYNRTPHSANEMIVPLQKYAPAYHFDLDQLKRFGCISYITIQRNTGPKFGPKAKRVILVGYSRTGYQFLEPEKGKFYESRNVKFNEKLVYKDMYKRDSIKDWPVDNGQIDKDSWFVEFEENMIDSDDQVKTCESGKIESEIEISKTEGAPKRKRGRPKKGEEKRTKLTTAQDQREGELGLETDEMTKVMMSYTFGSEPEERVDEYKDEVYYSLLAHINKDPASYAEAMQSREREQWQRAIDEELKSMEEHQVWKIVKRPFLDKNGRKPNIIDSRWVFKRKLEANGSTRFKARLVIRGFKDRTSYDLRETYAPVSRLPLVRALFSIINRLDLEVIQLDVKTAFLNGTLEREVLMEIPEGTVHSKQERINMICLLEKALYGLPVSPKRWNTKFTEEAIAVGLKYEASEPCVFTWKESEKFVVLLLYVDDIIMAGNHKPKLLEIKRKLEQKFKLTDLGEPKEFLGISVKRDRINKLIELSQESYVDKILEKFSLDKLPKRKTPMETSQVTNRKRRDREETDCDEKLQKTLSLKNAAYREVIGSLLYLANATRPDISYSVNVLSRHQIDPTDEDWKMVARVLGYLKQTKELSLIYKGETNEMEGYSDSSFGDCKGSLTTCGYVIKLFGDSVTWRTHKQTSVALSTCEAEFVAMSEATQELIGLAKSVEIMIDRKFFPIRLWCDNRAAISCTKIDGGTKLRHMVEIRSDYIKECVKNNLIEVEWVCSKEQLADIFTKPLPLALHENLRDRIMNIE